MRRRRRAMALLCRCIAVAVLAGGLAVLGASVSSSARADSAATGAKRYGACMAAQKAGDLLLLVDESRSLQASDPRAARVQAARYLLQTLGRFADRVKADLDVAVAGFADSYAVEHDWTRLTGATADEVGQQLSTLASKNTGLDTDYWLALDGARQTLASRGAGPGGANRCQAIAWFSDGKIDFTARPVTKPYADGVSLDSPNGIDETARRATEQICRNGGLADQLRSRGIVMLGVGLSAEGRPSDFDVMSAISTGHGVGGMSCGSITEPVPGDFYPASGIDDMLFAFDALNPEPGVQQKGPVCQLEVCEEARHDFVLDRSIKSVSILGSGGEPGIMPYLISPSGQKLELPKKPGKTGVEVAGVPVEYEWQSDSAQTISLRNTGGPEWAGRWAVVYVDTTGQHPNAVSRVNIHISTDIFPALRDAATLSWHSGQILKGLTFGLADGAGNPMRPDDLAGTAVFSAALVPDGASPMPLLVSVPKGDIAKPVDANLTAVKPGHAVLRMSLVITTAPATGPQGAEIAPGTTLSPQGVDLPIQILPKAGLPTPGGRIDFGTVQGSKGANATLSITGPGCAWIDASDATTVVAGPDGIGATHVTSSADGPSSCLKVPAGQTAELPVTLRTDHDGHGGLDGSVPLHVSALDNPQDTQVVDVPFGASLLKPLSTTNFVLVFIAALLLGPGIPLALLYASKWWVSKIPDVPMLAERIRVDVEADTVRRDGAPFAMAEDDLVRPVPGLTGGTRRLSVLGVTLATTVGRSPFGSGHVAVAAGDLVSAGSELPATDDSGVRAVLPLAVHNTWLVLHDPRGPATAAEVLLLVGGRTDTAARDRLYDEVSRRLPELLSALRLRAVQAGLASPHEPGQQASPFGEAVSLPHRPDPFGGAGEPMGPTGPMGDAGGSGSRRTGHPGRSDPHPFDPFG